MAIGGVMGAVIIGLGGAEDFLLAVGILIIMSVISVTSMFYVYRQHKSQQVKTCI